ncbi:unnamed protein product, partial [Cyprideis torosa]
MKQPVATNVPGGIFGAINTATALAFGKKPADEKEADADSSAAPPPNPFLTGANAMPLSSRGDTETEEEEAAGTAEDEGGLDERLDEAYVTDYPEEDFYLEETHVPKLEIREPGKEW